MKQTSETATRRLEDITALIVNYKTPDLTQRCIESLLSHYPDLHLLLIDNGSQDDSTAYIKRVSRQLHNVRCILNRENRYHGPAMDQGISSSSTSYVFTLDSDCEVLKGSFLEQMLGNFKDPNTYAVGQLMYMDRYGYEIEADRKNNIRYIHPHAMLLDREKYLTLPPFTHHGSPCLHNMKEANKTGYKVADFPTEAFIFHYEKGTCSRYGYGLSPKTLVEKLLSKLKLFV